ncbi:ester cyclase [Candidatus Neomarinimicrobiota bacterium]
MHRLLLLFAAIMLASCADMTRENTVLVLRYYAAINGGDTTAVETMISPTFTKHNNESTVKDTGPELFRQSVRMHQLNNTTYNFAVGDILAEGDKVAVRWTWNSVNRKFGEDKPVNIPGIAIFQVDDGLISELWQTFDMASYNRQLGLAE